MVAAIAALGHYGSKVDKEQGLKTLQRAVEIGNGETLYYLASFYVKGFGLKSDGKQAVRFAEAAYRQGNAKAASILAFINSKGLGEVEADEKLADFWGHEAAKPGFGWTFLDEKTAKELQKRLAAIDPSTLKVE